MKITLMTAVLIALPACAQSSGTDAATMQALLKEVHELRIAMEKSALLAPRLQLVLERAQMQEQRVARIAQQLEDVRKQVAGDADRQNRLTQSLARVEAEITGVPDGDHRRQLESDRASLKNALDAGPDQQLRAHEGELAASLQTEQAVLNDLNGKLDAIERLLDSSGGK